MPRRRMVTAKQRAASVRNLEIARKSLQGKRAVPGPAGKMSSATRPMGKKVIGFHHTSPEARKLINNNGFAIRDSESAVWFSTKKGGAAGYGSVTVKVKVPRKSITAHNNVSSKETWFGVDPKYLKALHGQRMRKMKAKQAGKTVTLPKIKVPTARTVAYFGSGPTHSHQRARLTNKSVTYNATGGKRVRRR